jgi:hypothetical protein
MLRDAYFRLCEAYMNGVLSDQEYGHMVENADAYLAVSSAIQIIGSNPVAPAVAISTSGGTTTTNPEKTESQPAKPPGSADSFNPEAARADASDDAKAKAATDAAADAAKKAKVTRDIVRQYLIYRDILRRETEAEWRRESRAR